jgi:uncharacterized protein YkwD
MLLLGVVAATLAFPGTTPGTTVSAAGALAPRTVCRGQAAPHAPPALQLRAMRCLIGWARRHGGQPALHRSPELDRSAGLRVEAIRRCQDFSHTPCGEPFIAVFQLVGYLPATGSVGENLAWGQGPLGSARSAMRSWLASPEHRQILFSPDWRDLGVARTRAGSLFGRPNVTVWAAQFGRRGVLPPLP